LRKDTQRPAQGFGVLGKDVFARKKLVQLLHSYVRQKRHMCTHACKHSTRTCLHICDSEHGLGTLLAYENFWTYPPNASEGDFASLRLTQRVVPQPKLGHSAGALKTSNVHYSHIPNDYQQN